MDQTSAGHGDAAEEASVTAGSGCHLTHRTTPGSLRAHRVAYWLTTGEWPADHVVRHTCDNPPCVNPAHLLLGTHSDNTQDKMDRGRQPVNANSLKTACKRDHPYTPENTGINGSTGARYCRECKRAWNRAWKAARRTT